MIFSNRFHSDIINQYNITMKRHYYILIITLLLLIGLPLFMSIWLPASKAFRLVYGFLYLLFFPGFLWSYVFWRPNELNKIPRLILALTISLAIVPLTVFTGYKIGIKINTITIFLEILFILAVGVIIISYQSLKKNNKSYER